MLNTRSVSHNYKSFLWVPDDVVEVAEKDARTQDYSLCQAATFALCVRVLEVWKDGRLEKLSEAGLDEKDLTEEMLWLDIEWPRVRRFALRIFCSESSLKKIFPRVIAAGFARQRYIKRDPKTGARVCDANGTPLVYSTYQAAKTDTYLNAEGEEKKYPGEIIHQAIFLSDALNRAIAALGRPLTPPPTPEGGGAPPDATDPVGTKNEGAQRGLHASEQPSDDRDVARVGNTIKPYHGVSSENIPPVGQKNQGESKATSRISQDMSQSESQKNQGVSTPASSMAHKKTQAPGQKGEESGQNCRPPEQICPPPVGKNGCNKNSNSKNLQVIAEETLTSTGGAAAPAAILSHFDFFQTYDQAALTDLFKLIMPLPTYKSSERQQSAELAMKKAAGEMADDPLFREQGLVHSARLMYYFVDPKSPCKWLAEIRGTNPGMQARPWHLTERVRRIASREMVACDWWPSCLPRTAGTSTEPPASEIEVVDLAELAGIADGERQGMTLDDTTGLMADIQTLLPPEEFSGVFVDYGSVERWKRARGYYVSFWPIDGLEIKLYSQADWQLVWANADTLGTPEFVPRLAEACTPNQVTDFEYEKEVS